MRLFYILPALLFSILTQASPFYKGENLITNFEYDEESYDVLEKNEGSKQTILWRSKSLGYGDAWIVSVFKKDKHTIETHRKVNDDPGKESCKSFESVDLSPIENTNYNSMIWKTNCVTQGDKKVQTIELIIKGKDSTYRVQKIWRGEVLEAQELNSWVRKFEKVFVCDTRKKAKACPEGFNQVKDV